jgi:probable rRNA maturation factor
MIEDAQVEVQNASDEDDLPDINQLNSWVNAALQVHFVDDKKAKVELTIRIVDELESQQLNARWRQKPYPTNVLSFPFEPPPDIDIPLLGDIVICAPLVAREAAEQHKSTTAHWAHLVIHGTLHLLGYDHIEELQAQIMESLEIRVLHDLAYPNPYQIL